MQGAGMERWSRRSFPDTAHGLQVCGYWCLSNQTSRFFRAGSMLLPGFPGQCSISHTVGAQYPCDLWVCVTVLCWRNGWAKLKGNCSCGWAAWQVLCRHWVTSCSKRPSYRGFKLSALDLLWSENQRIQTLPDTRIPRKSSSDSVYLLRKPQEAFWDNISGLWEFWSLLLYHRKDSHI